MTNSERIDALHNRLTWVQIAAVFGVSLRAVHKWAGGGRMTSWQTAKLEGILAQAREHADMPQPDLLAMLLAQRPTPPAINGGLPPEVLLGAAAEDGEH